MSDEFNAVVVLVGDQPHFRKEILQKIMEASQKNLEAIIVSKYDTGAGPPVMFPKKYFNELAQLDGDDGAKAVIKKHRECVRYVDFPKGDFDVDTPEDLVKFKLKNQDQK